MVDITDDLFLKEKPQYLIKQEQWNKLMSVLKEQKDRIYFLEKRVSDLEKIPDIREREIISKIIVPEQNTIKNKVGT